MTQPTASLIVGLGSSGGQTAALLWEYLERLYGPEASYVRVITVDFEPQPQPLAQAELPHVQLALNPGEALRRLAGKKKHTSHIDA
ncbi:MAG: hypothetical protein K8S97_08950, partial [Anaerolineae bacterium]|nr:hypothetical protein [Anaerolineae bacterium]